MLKKMCPLSLGEGTIHPLYMKNKELHLVIWDILLGLMFLTD